MPGPEAFQHTWWRCSPRPSRKGLPERLPITVAPALARKAWGGSCTQASSQTSTPTTRPGRFCASKSRSVPKGTVCPATSTVAPGGTSRPWRNWRLS